MDNKKTIGSLFVGISIILLAILGFVKADFDSQAEFLCENFHENNLDMSECPAHQSNASWFFTSAFGLGFLMLGLGGYMLFSKQQIPQTQIQSNNQLQTRQEDAENRFKEIDISKLDDAEKKIYNLLRENEGSMYQSDLIKETSFSKVQMTRILDKLENKGILERKRRGMTNIIVLS